MELAVAQKNSDIVVDVSNQPALPPLTKGVSSSTTHSVPKPIAVPKRPHHVIEQFLVPNAVPKAVQATKQEEREQLEQPKKTETKNDAATELMEEEQKVGSIEKQDTLISEFAAPVQLLEKNRADRPSTPKVRLRYHSSPGETQKSVYFPYPEGLGVKPRADPASNISCPKRPTRMKFLLYWERNCIKRVFKAAGLIRSSSPALLHDMQGNGDWNVAWTKHFPIEQYRTLKSHQRVNSFPGTGCIGRKDTLASILARFDRRFLDSDAFKFVPETFTLRGHYGEMERFLKAARIRAGHSNTARRATKSRKKRKNNTARRRLVGGSKRNGTDNLSDSDTGSSDASDASEASDDLGNELEREQNSIEALKRQAELDQERLSVKSKRLILEGERMKQHMNKRPIGSDLWICKPSASACGRGIRLVKYKDVPRLPMTIKVKDRSATAGINGETHTTRQRVWNVQEYIADPLCIEGRKFDLRVYVLVTSFDPLRVYVFREGLCRICTNKYDLDYDTLGDTFKHLTNFSINKNSSGFVANKNADDDDEGHKWSLSALFDHLDAHGYDVARLWRDMKEVAVKTLIACESEVFTKLKSLSGSDKCCYEVFGFDMLLNESLFVYLIEVNIYPSMATGSPLDKRIKETLITDALHIKGVPIPSKEQSTGPPKMSGLNRIKTKRLLNQQNRETLKRRLRTGKLGKLSNEDLDVIKESAAEFARASTTNYDIAFPSAQSIRRLSDFFICPRYNNTLLHMLILESEEDSPDRKGFQSSRTGRRI
jgi:hypothetical protein